MPRTITRTAAFFISPAGQVHEVRDESHVAMVIRSPKMFGLTREEIERSYAEHGEPLGVEGEARTRILLDLIRSGWIRTRRYPNRSWSINVRNLTPETLGILGRWAKGMLNGSYGLLEPDPYMPIKVLDVNGHAETSTVSALAQTDRGDVYGSFSKPSPSLSSTAPPRFNSSLTRLTFAQRRLPNRLLL